MWYIECLKLAFQLILGKSISYNYCPFCLSIDTELGDEEILEYSTTTSEKSICNVFCSKCGAKSTQTEVWEK